MAFAATVSSIRRKPGARDQKLCDFFPTFSHLFTKLMMNTRNGQRLSLACSDSGQKDLLRCMQLQIQSHSTLVSVVAKCMDYSPRGDDRDAWIDSDDSSDSSELYDLVESSHKTRAKLSSNNFEQGLFYRINSHRPEVTSIIRKVFSDRSLSSWMELPSVIREPFWNLQWTWGLPKASDFEDLLVFQKINRFRHTRGLTRKDLLKKNIQRFGSTYKLHSLDGCNTIDDCFNIMPLTYALPHEFNAFVAGYSSIKKIIGNKATNVWIIKPVGLSRGRGISLVSDVSNVSYSQPMVVQRYIADPLCFLGYKFDLRIYVLVTSFNPLEAFIFKEGLARFGTRPYSPRPEFLHDHRIHLTNSSIQKEFQCDIDRSHPAYLAGSDGAESKVALSWLWKRLESLGLNIEYLWIQIVEVCLKSLVAAGSEIPYQPNAFEVGALYVNIFNSINDFLCLSFIY